MAGSFAGTADAFRDNVGGSIKAPVMGFIDKKSRRAAIDPLDFAGEPKMPEVPAIPPPPTAEDPEIVDVRQKARDADLKRKGRRASILTSARGVEDDLGAVNRPQARAAALLGQ